MPDDYLAAPPPLGAEDEGEPDPEVPVDGEDEPGAPGEPVDGPGIVVPGMELGLTPEPVIPLPLPLDP